MSDPTVDYDQLHRDLSKALRLVEDGLKDARDVEHDAGGWTGIVDEASDIENTANEAASALDSLADLLLTAIAAVPPSGGAG